MRKIGLLSTVALLFATVTTGPALAGEYVLFYHNDTLGSPVAVTDINGNVVWRADYEPFGNPAILTETLPNTHQFLGKEVDAETSLHYLGARFYDGGIGRFLSLDPALLRGQPDSALKIPQRLGFYTYSTNNPYRFLDPDGSYTFPVKFGGQLTQGYWSSRKPTTHSHPGGKLHVHHPNGIHESIDIAAPYGTPAVAIAGGVVLGSGDDKGTGKWIEYETSDGLRVKYLHLSKIDVEAGEAGKEIYEGQQIGNVGNTGCGKCGSHLHVQIRDKQGNPIDPLAIILNQDPGNYGPHTPTNDRFDKEYAPSKP